MWTVFGVDEAGREQPVSWRSLESFEGRDQIARAAEELQASATVPLPLTALYRDIESDDAIVGIDGIERWGRRAAEQLGPQLVFDRIGMTADGRELEGLMWFGNRGLEAVAFHWPEAVVADVSGLGEIRVVDANDVTPGGEIDELPFAEASFEWRLYAGSGTHTAEGESSFDPPAAAGARRSAPVRLLGAAGQLLVGRPLRWLGRDRKPTHDPAFEGRLRDLERRNPDVTTAYPDIGRLAGDDVPSVPAGAVLVAVHGTYSCAVPLVAQLHPLGVPTVRFEHDTFRSLYENAIDLAHAVGGLGPQVDPVYLLGHSRGGLVARLAARELADERTVVVRTYGTPHLGTPLANAGSRALKALSSAGRIATGPGVGWDPVSRSFLTLLRRGLPEGLEVMRTDSEALKMLRVGTEPGELLTYGADYDAQRAGDGASAYTLGAIAKEAFGQEPHDTVVPTGSSLGAGSRQPVLTCDHFHYFLDPAVVAELRGLT